MNLVRFRKFRFLLRLITLPLPDLRLENPCNLITEGLFRIF